MIGHKEVIKEIDAPHIHLDFHAILNHDDANIPQVEKCRLDVSHIKMNHRFGLKCSHVLNKTGS